MDIQARLYWQILKQNLCKDEYFKDFELLDYRFIVVNKKTLNPLVWECPFTKAVTELYFGKDKQIHYRTPFEIGKELTYYLKNNPKVPIGISETEPNDLREWLNKL